MKKILKKIIQYLCTHKYVCTYVYNISADWRCVKCGKRKKDFAPLGFTKTEMDYNNHYFKNIFKN